MSNFSVIKRMLDSIEKYESGKLTATDLEQSLETHMRALEGIGSREISASRDLAYRIVKAHLVDDAQEFEGDEKVSEVVGELRQFLRSLPGGAET